MKAFSLRENRAMNSTPGAPAQARHDKHDTKGTLQLPAQLTLQRINALDRDAFSAALAQVFEGPPEIVAEAWERRPFTDREALYRALVGVMEAMPAERQVALLRAHPDLVGRAALAGTLSRDSTAEQAAAGLNRLSPEDVATFNRLNAAYRTKFGFPFIVCARENTKATILAGFEERLPHDRDDEIRIALGEVAKICRLRLASLVRDGGEKRDET